LPASASISFGLTDIYQTGQPAKGLAMLRSLEPKHYCGLYGPELHRLYAGPLLADSPQATDEAEARLREAVALARERQMKALELRAAMSLARLLAPYDRRAARAALSVVDGSQDAPKSPTFARQELCATGLRDGGPGSTPLHITSSLPHADAAARHDRTSRERSRRAPRCPET
jgi:hypothetical protein